MRFLGGAPQLFTTNLVLSREPARWPIRPPPMSAAKRPRRAATVPLHFQDQAVPDTTANECSQNLSGKRIYGRVPSSLGCLFSFFLLTTPATFDPSSHPSLARRVLSFFFRNLRRILQPKEERCRHSSETTLVGSATDAERCAWCVSPWFRIKNTHSPTTPPATRAHNKILRRPGCPRKTTYLLAPHKRHEFNPDTVSTPLSL